MSSSEHDADLPNVVMRALYGRRARWKETGWFRVLVQAAEAEASGAWTPDIAERVRGVLHELMHAAVRLDYHSFARLAEVIERTRKLNGRWEDEPVAKLLFHTGGLGGDVNLEALSRPEGRKPAVLDYDRKTRQRAARVLRKTVKTGRPRKGGKTK